MVEDIRNIDDTKVIAHKLSVLETLLECITILSRHEDLEKGMNHLLQIIREYFDSDRAYVFENNYTKGVTNNTYESVKEGVTAQIDFLQNVPLSAVEKWLEEFNAKVEKSLDLFVEREISTSYGVSWRGKDNDIHVQMQEADKRMYAHKNNYYENLRIRKK